MKTVFSNLTNGNIKDAKAGAEKYGQGVLSSYAFSVLGWTVEKSYLAARLLKGEDCWQNYCDAK